MKQLLQWSGAAWLVAVVTGCAAPEQPRMHGMMAGCHGLANVTVGNILLAPAGADIDPDPVCINFDTGNAVVRWSFAKPGYVFPADAVTFESGAPPFRGQVLPHGSAFQAEIDPTALSRWKYTLKFQSTAPPSITWVCDPTIINQGSLLGTKAGSATAQAASSCTAALSTP